MSTHGYTSADFAAVLMECGPHVTDCIVCKQNDTNHVCPNVTRYKDRVYSQFFELFPEMVYATDPDTPSTQMHEWTAFWHEYLAWIGVGT